MAEGVFIKILPQLELAALAAVFTQLKSLMGKAGGDIAAALDKNQGEINRLTDAVVAKTNDAARAQIAAYKAAGDEAVAQARRIEVANSKAADSTKLRANNAAAVAAMKSGQATDEATQKADKAAKANKDLTVAQEGATAAALAQSKAFDTLGAGAALVTGALAVGGIDAAKNYEFGLASLQARTDQTAGSMKILHDGLLQVSAQTGASLQQLTEASTLVAKAGPNFQNAADNLKLVGAAAQLAAIEGTGLDNSMKAILFTIKDFSQDVGDAVTVASMLRAAAGDAAVSIDELAGSLHNVEPVMKLLSGNDPVKGKQMFSQMSALVATGTQGGMSADQTTDLVNNTVMGLISGSGPARNMWGAIGGGSFEALQQQVTTDGPIPVLQKMYDTVMSKVGPDGLVKLSDTYNSVDQHKVLDERFAALSPQAQAIAKSIDDGTIAPGDMRTALREGPEHARLQQWYQQDNMVKGFDPVVKKYGSDEVTPEQVLQALTNSQSGLKVLSQDFSTPDARAMMEKTKDDTMYAHGDNAGKDVSGWAAISTTLKVQLDQMKRSMTDCAVVLGESLLPILKHFVDGLTDLFKFFEQHKVILDGLAAIVAAMAGKWIALKAAMAISGTVEGLTTGFGGVSGAAKTAATEAENATTRIGGLTKGFIGMAGPVGALIALATQLDDMHVPTPGDIGAASGKMSRAWVTGQTLSWDDALAQAQGYKDANEKKAVENQGPTTDKGVHGRPELPFNIGAKAYADAHPNGANGANGAGDGGGYTPPAAPGAASAPAGTASDPVTVTIPGLQDMLSSATGGDSSGGGGGGGSYDGSGGSTDGTAVDYNPFKTVKNKGLPGLAQIATTFLAEMALGNPLGKLMTGQYDGGAGSEDSGVDTSQLGDLSKMSASDRKKAEFQIRMNKAKAEFEKAQRAYVDACNKYGPKSKQALNAYDSEATALDNLDLVAASEQDSAQTAVQNWQQAKAALAADKPGTPKYNADLAKVNKYAGMIPSGATATDSNGNNIPLPGGDTTSTAGGANPTDASVLSMLGKGGHYVPGGADLANGLADCSGAVASLVKIYEGANVNAASTKTHDFTTGPGEGAWLTQHGFLPTNVPMPGTLQVGYDGGHTQATLPGGSNINYGNTPDVANGGLAPNSGGAWMPGFTSHYYRPQDGSVPAASATTTTAGSAPLGGGQVPLPLPVTIVGGGGGWGAPGAGGGGGGTTGGPGAPGAPGGGGTSPGNTTTGGAGAPSLYPLPPNIHGGPLNTNPSLTGPVSGSPGSGIGLPWTLGGGSAFGGPIVPGGPDIAPMDGGPGAPNNNRAPGQLGPFPIPAGGVSNAAAGASALSSSRALAGAGVAKSQSQAMGEDRQGQGFGITGGGLIGLGESAASSAAGAAAGMGTMGAAGGVASMGSQIAMQEANRFAGYVGQVGGILAAGALETFGLNDSPLSDPSKTLPGKILFGLAGAHPKGDGGGASGKNNAGQAKGADDASKTQPPVKPDDGGPNKGQDANPGPGNTMNVTNNFHGTNDNADQVNAETNRAFLANGGLASR